MPEDYNPFKTEYERKPSASNWESLYENFSRGGKKPEQVMSRESTDDVGYDDVGYAEERSRRSAG